MVVFGTLKTLFHYEMAARDIITVSQLASSIVITP